MKYLLVLLILLVSLYMALSRTRYLSPAWQRVMKEKACGVIQTQVKASILWEGPDNEECRVHFYCPKSGPSYCLRLPLPGPDLILGVSCP